MKNLPKIRSNKVAVIIVNYNMPERADNLCDYLRKVTKYPMDIYLVDNGSDIISRPKNTNVFLEKNVQTTNGWLAGLKESDKKKYSYFAYMFLITSAEFTEESKDPVKSMITILKENKNAVGVHASLTSDSTTNWEFLKNKKGSKIRKTWLIDNICSIYRADWFNSIGRFDKNLTYAWGIDLETSYLARKEGRSLWIDDRIQVKKVTNIGYKMKRMNMSAEDRSRLAWENTTKVLTRRYGPQWEEMMLNEYLPE